MQDPKQQLLSTASLLRLIVPAWTKVARGSFTKSINMYLSSYVSGLLTSMN